MSASWVSEPPERTTKDAVLQLQNELQALVPTDNFDDFYPEIAFSYATGKREQDEHGTGPGVWRARDLISLFFSSGLPCISGLMLPPGEDWRIFLLRIDGDRSTAKVLVVLLTRALFRSLPCLLEIHAALKRGVDIVPVRVDPAMPPKKTEQWPLDELLKPNASTRERNKYELIRRDALQDFSGLNSIPPQDVSLFDRPYEDALGLVKLVGGMVQRETHAPSAPTPVSHTGPESPKSGARGGKDGGKGGDGAPNAAAKPKGVVPLASLDVEGVCALLEALSFGDIAPMARKSRFVGEDLAFVELDDLAGWGLDSKPRQRRLLQKIKDFEQTGVPAELVQGAGEGGGTPPSTPPAKPPSTPPAKPPPASPAPAAPATPAPAAPATGAATGAAGGGLSKEQLKALDWKGLVAAVENAPDAESAERAVVEVAVRTKQAGTEQPAADAGAVRAIIKALEKHAKAASTQAKATNAMINVIYGKDEAGYKRKQQAVDQGVLPIVMRAMEAHADHQEMQLKGCSLVKSVCLGPGTRKQAAADAGAVKAVVRAMDKHPKSAELQKEACIALYNICTGMVAVQKQAKDAGAVAAAERAKREHPSDEKVKAEADDLLKNRLGVKPAVALTKEQLKALDWKGLIAAVENAPDADAVSTAMFEVGVRTKQAGSEQPAADAGAVRAIVKAMERHAKSSNAQAKACNALYNVMYGKDEAGYKRKQQAVDEGVLPAVIRSMDQHSGFEEMQLTGCKVLQSVCLGPGTRKKAAADAGAVKAFVRAMDSHVKSAKIQIEACIGLYNICSGTNDTARAIQQQAIDAGARAAAERAKREHPSDEKVKAEADDLLQKRLGPDAGTRAAAGAAAGAGAGPTAALTKEQLEKLDFKGLVAAIDSAAASESSINAGAAVRALDVLIGKTRPDGSEQPAVDAGALHALVHAMKTYAKHAEVQAKACSALHNICHSSDPRKQAAAEAGVLPPVVSAINAHPADKSVHQKACQALANVCRGTTAAALTRKQQAAEAGAISAVVAAMTASAKHKDVLSDGCDSLINLLGGKDDAALARNKQGEEAGVLRAAVAAMDAFPDEANLQRLASQVVACQCYGLDSGRGQKAADAGALQAILRAMEKHPKEALLQQKACIAVYNMVAGSDSLKRRAVELGARTAAERAKREHASDENVQEEANDLIKRLKGF